MDRMRELEALQNELKQAPKELDYVQTRLRAKIKGNKRWNRYLAVPLQSMASIAVLFVVLVNISPTFASACGRLDYIRELAKMVAMSPSLEAAVDNDYVQPVELKMEDNGIAFTIEYLIVDQRQLNIFYTLEGEGYSRLELHPEYEAEGALQMGWGSGFSQSGELQFITMDVFNGEMPSQLTLKAGVEGQKKTPDTAQPAPKEELGEEDTFVPPVFIAEFTVELNFDPTFTDSGEKVVLNQTVTVDGQDIRVHYAEIFPSFMSINVSSSKDNTATLEGLQWHLESEEGERFDPISNGISSAGTEEDGSVEYRIESPYFHPNTDYSIVISAISLLEKDLEYVTLDLVNETVEFLPQGYALADTNKLEKGWEIILTYDKSHGSQGNLLGNYQTMDGEIRTINNFSSNVVDGEEQSMEKQRYVLHDCEENVIDVQLHYSKYVLMEEPIVIALQR